jgi:hypothetical protein
MKSTNFKLSEEQEKDLLKYATDRVEQLKVDNKERIDVDKGAWNVYNNERDDRHNTDSIYSQSNVPIPLTSLVVDHFLARAEDELTGTSPYFKFVPQGASDQESSEKYDKYFHWKLEKIGKTRERLEECYTQLFIQRAAILKVTYEEIVSEWLDYDRKALFNNANGDFEMLPGYGPVIEGDSQFQPTMAPDGSQTVALVDDPSFILDPQVHTFEDFPEGVPSRQVKYSGPRSRLIDSDRFLAPSNVENIEDADFIAEMYDKDTGWLEEMYLEREWLPYEEFYNKIKKDANARTDVQVNEEYKEDLSFDNLENPKIQVVECWVKRDVLGNGVPQDFVLFIEPETKTAIYYEYVAKVTPDNQIPYTSIAIGKAKSRWWGPSLPEKINIYQEYIDRQFNSESYRNEMSANPIVAVHPQAVEDEPDDIELHAGKIFQLKEQNQLQDFIEFAQIPSADAKTQELIDFVFGMVQLWLGVSNLAQGDYQALAPANTATGVEATLNEASKIGRRWMRRIVKGLENHLTKMVKLAMATMDKEEVFEYMEGDVSAFATMTPEMIKKFEVNALVILSQDQGQRAIEKANLALQVQERFFNYPPEIRPFVRPMLKRILDAMGFENSDELLPQQAPADPQQQAEQAKLEGDAQASGQGGGGGGGGAVPEAKDQVDAQVQGMGNSNPQGQNQFQQRV